MASLHSQRYAVLDLIRVFAMGLIVWFHIAITYNYIWRRAIVIPKVYSIDIGNIGVTIFLILSGLVLELMYGKKQLSWRQFYFKRVTKIFTVYLVCVVFALIIRGYKNLVYFETTLFDCPECTWTNVACTLGGFCSQIGLWGGPFMRTGWFIGLILVLYMFFPWFSTQLKKHPFLFLVLLFVISLGSRLVLKSIPNWPAKIYDPLEWVPLNRFFEFGLGIFLANKMNPRLFEIPHLPLQGQRFLTFLSEISFPVFLLHYELDFIMILFDRYYILDLPGTIYYLVWVVLTCYLAYWVSQRVLKITMRPFKKIGNQS